jgi:hypothetical protein
MKNKFFIFLLLIPYMVSAQNPYAQFGCKVTELTVQVDTSYQIIYNSDPTAEIHKIGFDFKNKKVDFYGTDNTIVKILFIPPDIFLHWISPDPKAKDYPGWSPYNFVEGNPINNIDPDGGSIKPATQLAEDNFYDALSTFTGGDIDQADKLFGIKTVQERFDNGGLQPVLTVDASKKNVNRFINQISKKVTAGEITVEQAKQAVSVYNMLASTKITELGIIANAQLQVHQLTPADVNKSGGNIGIATVTNNSILKQIPDALDPPSVQNAIGNANLQGSVGVGDYGFFKNMPDASIGYPSSQASQDLTGQLLIDARGTSNVLKSGIGQVTQQQVNQTVLQSIQQTESTIDQGSATAIPEPGN